MDLDTGLISMQYWSEQLLIFREIVSALQGSSSVYHSEDLHVLAVACLPWISICMFVVLLVFFFEDFIIICIIILFCVIYICNTCFFIDNLKM